MNPKLERYRAAQLNQDIGGNEMNSKSVAIFTGVGVDTLMCRVDENGEKLLDWLNENRDPVDLRFNTIEKQIKLLEQNIDDITIFILKHFKEN